VDSSFGSQDVGIESLERAYNWVQHLLPQSAPRSARIIAPAAPAAAASGNVAVHVSSSISTHDAPEPAAPAAETDFPALTQVNGPNLVQIIEAILALPAIDAAYIVLHRLPQHALHTIAPVIRERLAGTVAVAFPLFLSSHMAAYRQGAPPQSTSLPSGAATVGWRCTRTTLRASAADAATCLMARAHSASL
jgi:hypothetical protein